LIAVRSPSISFLSVCSGIEAASVAWKPLGWKHIGFAEIEKFPSAVLAHHYPNVPNHGDFTKIETRRLPRIDILCGGTPCQAFSVAGGRASLSDARGNLTLAFVGLAHELADNNGLRNVVWENVPGVLSTHDNAFGCFLAGLVGADGPFVPTLAKPLPGKSNRAYGWSAKSKSHYIKWPRYGVVTGPKGRAAWTVKDAQYYGLAQRRERVLVVADFGNGADPAAVLFEQESVRRNSPPSREAGERVAPTISARPTGGGGLGTDFDLDGGLIHAIQAGAIRTNPNSGPDGVGVQADIAFTLEARAEVQAVSYAPTMRAGGHSTSHANAGVMPAVLTLQSAVRRLTPRECERLMGFPDDYTLIPWRGKPPALCPDGPRYKALGNSWAVPKFRWLGERIARFMPSR
jgi:DNA (cytosine-5)-methyltransferase 1